MQVTRERAFQAKGRAKQGQHGGMAGARVVDSWESVGREVRDNRASSCKPRTSW